MWHIPDNYWQSTTGCFWCFCNQTKPYSQPHQLFSRKAIPLWLEDPLPSVFPRYKPSFSRGTGLFMPLLPVLGQVRFVVEAGSNFSEVGPQYKSCCCFWSLLKRRTPWKLATYGKHFFSERLPISQLLPQENTINSSVTKALLYTLDLLTTSSYHVCPPVSGCWLAWNKKLTLEGFS